MKGGVVCYVEREQGGVIIRRVRLVAAGLSRSWTAPEEHTVSSAPQDASSPGAALATTRTAAAWIAETISTLGLKRIARLCIDAEGSLCAWMSAPSPDQDIIEASFNQSAQDAGAPDAASGLGAGRLLAMTTPSGSDALAAITGTSVQALAIAEEEPEPSASPRLALRGRSKPTRALAVERHRYAVLAVADAPVRVLLDELDSLGIEVEAVSSLWHAMAQSWDEGQASTAGSLDAGAGVSATVLIDPARDTTGRLIWCWSRAGELLAAGSLRLTAQSAPMPMGQAQPQAQPAASTLSFTSSEIGRLVMDWLSWSVQLGLSPRRIVCIATPTLTDGSVDGAAALGRNLARAWPGATVDATTHEDPLGATIARLAGLGTDADAHRLSRPDPELTPLSAIMPLATRPGRQSRSMFRWAALSLVGLALIIGVLGWQLGQAAVVAENQVKEAGKSYDRALAELEPIIPSLSTDRKPLDSIEAKLKQLRDVTSKVRPPRPVLEETMRVFKSLEGLKDVQLTEFEVNALFNAKFTVNVPDAVTGPTILKNLNAIPGSLIWSGNAPTSGLSSQRQYILGGLWPAEPSRVGAGGGQ